jgi:hypothetical protein
MFDELEHAGETGPLSVHAGAVPSFSKNQFAEHKGRPVESLVELCLFSNAHRRKENKDLEQTTVLDTSASCFLAACLNKKGV